VGHVQSESLLERSEGVPTPEAFVAIPVPEQRSEELTRGGLVGGEEQGPDALLSLGANRGVGRALGLGDVEVEPARGVDAAELERQVSEVVGVGGEEGRRGVADQPFRG
jgi:hypothetical protein